MAGKKISQLPSGSLASLPLNGLTPVVHSGVTYQHTLNQLRQILVDSGSHHFTGSQFINGNLTVQENVNFSGSLNIGSVNEKIVLEVSGGTSTYEFDYNDGSVYYLTNSLNNNTYNVSNVPTENLSAISLTFIVKQESTPYIASSYRLNNESVTVSWANNEQPVGNSNKTDVIGLTALRVESSWNILGTFTTFG